MLLRSKSRAHRAAATNSNADNAEVVVAAAPEAKKQLLPPLLFISHNLLDHILSYLTPKMLVKFSLVSKEVGALFDARGTFQVGIAALLPPSKAVQFTLGKHLSAKFLFRVLWANTRGGRRGREVVSRPAKINSQWSHYLSVLKDPGSGEVNLSGRFKAGNKRSFLGAVRLGCNSETDFKTNPMILPASTPQYPRVNVSSLHTGPNDILVTCLNPDCGYAMKMCYVISSFCDCDFHDDYIDEEHDVEDVEVVRCSGCDQSTCAACMSECEECHEEKCLQCVVTSCEECNKQICRDCADYCECCGSSRCTSGGHDVVWTFESDGFTVGGVYKGMSNCNVCRATMDFDNSFLP